MKRKLNPYAPIDFNCDNCQKEFKSALAYSPSLNSEQITETYCVDCFNKRNPKYTGRNTIFAVRTKEEWIKQLKAIAKEEKCGNGELLEKALRCYEKHRK